MEFALSWSLIEALVVDRRRVNTDIEWKRNLVDSSLERVSSPVESYAGLHSRNNGRH